MSTIVSKLFVGMVAPKGIVLTVKRSCDLEDMTTVTSGVIMAQTPGGIISAWSGTVSQQRSDSLVITHLFASDGSDLCQVGNWFFWPVLQTPAGPFWGFPICREVFNIADPSTCSSC
jgi:hypothetical protein